MRIEVAEKEYKQRHDDVRKQTEEITDRISAAHFLIYLLES
jgi:L-rhamnose mutarotase